MKLFSRSFPFFAAAFVLMIPASAFAQDAFIPLTHLPGLSDIVTSPTLPAFLNQLYRICIGAAAVIAVIQIMRAGISIMTNQGSFTQNSKARERLTNTFLGLILVLSPAIVFGIINPKILDLGLDFSSLKSTATSPSSSQSPTGNETLDRVNRQICEAYAKPGTKLAYASLKENQSCSDVKGAGWTKIDTNCCPANPPAGQVCCGYSPSNDPPPATDNTLGPASYSIAFQDQAFLNDQATTQQSCLAYADQSFNDQKSCLAAFNGRVAATKTTYAIAKSCTDTGSHTPTPAASWDKLKSLPACPPL